MVDLTGGGGFTGTIRGTATVNSGGTLRLSVNDATGYATDATRLSVINLAGGTLHVNTTANQTLGSAVVNMTGASITGIAGSNIDLFANGSAINTLASATTSTISLPSMNLRQNDTVFTTADGAAATDLLISSNLGNGSVGNHNLIKTGAGTMVLTGTNTYSGTTQVNLGTLLINGNNSAATGTVTIASGAILGGTGSIGGAVNVTGTLAPGASIESLGTGALNFATGSTFAYELDSSTLNGDLLDSTGTLDIAPGAILTLTELAFGTLANNSKLTLISYTGGWLNTELFTYLGGTLNNGDIIHLGSNQWQFDYNDNAGGSNHTSDQSGATRFVTMTVVPEPSAALLGALGLLPLLRRRRDGQGKP